MELIQYKPWEKNEVESIIKDSNNSLPILDIQLGGACNLQCVYCDTPKYGLPCLVNLEAIEKLMNEGNIKWVYVCGLGEPTALANLKHLKHILKLCKERNVGLSMFSNMLNVDNELLDYIDNGTLNVLFKLDTFNKKKMSYLYGADKGDTILKNYKKLEEVVHAKDGVTNLGASIVPTRVNNEELPFVIDYCMNKNIFPLIGQLEDAGNCSKVYKELELNEEELLKLKNYLFYMYGVKYDMPTCPATISGIHVTNTNNIILDKRTGLSCPWFWLDEPEIEVIGNINDMSYNQILNKVIDYRRSKINDVKELEEHVELYPFGGCGGNVKKLLRTYIDIYNR